jgi:hypothetical protein
MLCVAPKGLSQETDREFLANFVEKDLLKNHTHWFVREAHQQASNVHQLNEDGVKVVQEIQSVETVMSNYEPFLIMLGLDTLRNVYGVHFLNKMVTQFIAWSKKMKSAIIAIHSESREWNLGTTAPSSHWKIDMIGNSLTIQGIIPQTGVFVLSPDLLKGSINYRLIPIV